MNQAFHVHRVQCHEDTKTGHGADDPTILFPQVFAHVFALEPSFNVTARLVSPPFIGAAMHPRSLPSLIFETDFFRFMAWISGFQSRTFFQPPCQLGVGLSWYWQNGQLIPALCQNCLDHAVHQQVRVAPDRAGEMAVSVKCQAKMATVNRGVDGLLHGTQQHGVNLLRIRPIFGRRGNRLELTG